VEKSWYGSFCSGGLETDVVDADGARPNKAEGEGEEERQWNGEQQDGQRPFDQDVPMSEASAVAV